MAMLEYNEILPKTVIVHDGEPYVVLSSWIFRKQMRKPVNQTKLRNLISGSVIEHTFQQTDKADQAEIESRPGKFIYNRNGEWWFCDPKNAADRFKLEDELVGDQGNFLLINMEVELMLYEEKVFSMKMPVKVDLKVKEAPPNIKGDTAQGGNKNVIVETGAVVSTPLFIETNDVIRVNTTTGEYVERVTKAK
jgi:elongation factor P